MAITTTPSGGPQGEFSTYTPIYAQTLSSAVASITFSSIPSTYTDLVVIVNGTTSGGSANDLFIRFNGDTSTNYSWTYLAGNGSAASSGRSSNATYIPFAGYPTGWNVSSQGAQIIQIQNYSNATTYKTLLARSNNSISDVAAYVGLWRNTTAITSFDLKITGSYNWNAGSTFTLYGVKAAATAPKAAGGDVITTDGTYWYHAFKTTGLFDVKLPITADVLVVAGGGSGGATYDGGGGGAGGLRGFTSQSLSLNTYAVTVGAGGTNGANFIGGNGTNSS